MGDSRVRALVVAVVTTVALAGCGDAAPEAEPDSGTRTIPVGTTTWDATAPAWYDRGTLHVGERSVSLGRGVDSFVVSPTGAYWMRGSTLRFTSADGATVTVGDGIWNNLAISADGSVVAFVDQAHGPTDHYGTHVAQLVVFDTRTGEQLYRTPDEKPGADEDLAALYPEVMPLLHGVSPERAFFDGRTIALSDGSEVEATRDGEGGVVYADYADTLFPDGYRVTITGQGRHRRQVEVSSYAVGRLSPERTLLFDLFVSPGPQVVYDAATGRQRPLDAPWSHFDLAGWVDDDTFFGLAIKTGGGGVTVADQVVTCEVSTLACTPVSRVIPVDFEDPLLMPATTY